MFLFTFRVPAPWPLSLTAILWATAALTSPVAAQVDDLGAAEETYAVRPGDQVTISFFTAAGDRLEVIAGTRTVDRDGRLFLPYVGSVDVTGLDVQGIRERLEQLYARFYTDPVVDVTVELRINVTGAVRNPGSIFIDPSATLIDVLSEAGGVGIDVVVASNQIAADPSKVRLVRDGRVTILDVRPEHVTQDVLSMPIQSGDWIFVPPRPRSRIRDEIQFWGGVLSFATTVVALVVLIN